MPRKSDLDYTIERRKKLLVDGIERRRALARSMFQMPGQRPAFAVELTRGEMLGWWMIHRHDSLGAKVLSSYTDVQRMELDRALSEHIQQQALGGME